jgi:hypothetical protein
VDEGNKKKQTKGNSEWKSHSAVPVGMAKLERFFREQRPKTAAFFPTLLLKIQI